MHFEHGHQFVSFWRGLFSISRRWAIATFSISNWKNGRLTSEKIWKIWKKGKLKSEKIRKFFSFFRFYVVLLTCISRL
jgi:hypothetical protein